MTGLLCTANNIDLELKKKKKGLGHPDIIQSLKRQVRLGNTNNLKMKTIVTGYTLQFKVKYYPSVSCKLSLSLIRYNSSAV